MRKRVRRRAAALAAALSLALTACGTGSGGPGGDTLTVWIMQGTNPGAEPFFARVGKEFTQRTGAALDVQYVPWPDAHDKFTKAMAGGTTPDVAEVGTTWTAEFADAGALADLTAFSGAAGLDDDMVPALRAAGTYEGRLYGVPWYAGVRALLYRSDVFERHGLSAPADWDELREVAQTLGEKEPGLLPFPVPGDSEYVLDAFIWGAGGELAIRDGGRWTSAVDRPAAVRGVDFYTSLATRYGTSAKAVTTWDEADLVAGITRGKVAMAVAGSWTPAAITADAPELAGRLAAAPLPGPDGGISPSFLGGSHLSVFNSAPDPELAWEFVELLTSREFAADWAEQSGYFPGRTSQVERAGREGGPLVAPFARQMAEGGRTVPVTPAYGRVQGEKTLARMVQAILSGRKSVREATAQAAADMDETFGR
ncbi:sugar ABC transporter substrate-binding protein [Streptomyces sp. TRM 70351]|uniref:sugar ABC transporter substrate-binding protein n=1 Tax=Streptomyces sp. TRM 70351 TaxID=3116552 RepID=UPI002E7B84B2|nr:sugar ABC transporter substrate-binding protein [Streptomyces sp. TRM 70351]MEE1930491.1 sugar ABC transporter substrate-binding protein [Streptomyces sp. TRM 70351]